MKVAQLCPTLCNPMDCNLTGSSIHGILQARILEWVAMPFSHPGTEPQSPTLQADSLPSEPPGKPVCSAKELYHLLDILCLQISINIHIILKALYHAIV